MVECAILVVVCDIGITSRRYPSTMVAGTIIRRHRRSLYDEWRSNDFDFILNQSPDIFSCGDTEVGSTPNVTPYYDGLSKLATHIVAAAHSRSSGSKKLVLNVSKEAEDSYTDQVEVRSHHSSPSSLLAK